MAIITLNADLIGSDIGSDVLEVLSDEIFNLIANPVGTIPMTITGRNWPVWGTTFELNEPRFSATVTDETGLLTSAVGNPAAIGGGWLDSTWIDIDSDLKTFNAADEFTVEALVMPTVVNNGVPGESTFNRIFERKNTLLITILHTDYRGDDIPSRSGKASIEVKYRVSSRYTSPHPQWPADPYTGNSVWMH